MNAVKTVKALVVALSLLVGAGLSLTEDAQAGKGPPDPVILPTHPAPRPVDNSCSDGSCACEAGNQYWCALVTNCLQDPTCWVPMDPRSVSDMRNFEYQYCRCRGFQD